MVGVRRTGSALLLALAAILLPAAFAAAQCRTHARIEPDRAVVGQRVFWTLEILRARGVEKVEWLEAPRFPSFRAAWLPGRVDPAPIARDGALWRRSEERRALFAARPGTLRVPGAKLRCGAEPAVVGGVTLEVAPLPGGAPPGFTGVVGPVRVITRIEPERIRLGEAARLWVVLRGPGNLWTVTSPLTEAALEGVDVFAEPPATDLDADEDLAVRRTFRYQLVPRREGTLTLPAFEVPWFDAGAAMYRIARGPSRTLRVGGTATFPRDD